MKGWNEATVDKANRRNLQPKEPAIERTPPATIEGTTQPQSPPVIKENHTWAKPRRPTAQVSTWQPDGEPKRVVFDNVPESQIPAVLAAVQRVLPSIYIP